MAEQYTMQDPTIYFLKVGPGYEQLQTQGGAALHKQTKKADACLVCVRFFCRMEDWIFFI